MGTLLDQSIPNIRHPLTALFLHPSADLAPFNGSSRIGSLLPHSTVISRSRVVVRVRSENWPFHSSVQWSLTKIKSYASSEMSVIETSDTARQIESPKHCIVTCLLLNFNALSFFLRTYLSCSFQH